MPDSKGLEHTESKGGYSQCEQKRYAVICRVSLSGPKLSLLTLASRRRTILYRPESTRDARKGPVTLSGTTRLSRMHGSRRTTAATRLSNFSRLFASASQTNETLSGFGVSYKCGRCCQARLPAAQTPSGSFPHLSIALRSSRAIPFGDDFSPGSGRGFFAPLSIALPYRICVTLSGMTRKLPDTCAYGHIIDGSYCAPGKKPRRYCKKCAVRRVEEMRERRKAANTKVSNK